RPRGAACDIGAVETTCSPTPLVGCVPARARASRLSLTDFPGDRDRLAWRWRSGAPVALDDFGDPSTASDYGVCVWATGAAEPLLLEAEAPAGGTCDGTACWTAVPGAGFDYDDGAAASGGLRRIRLRARSHGRASILVTAKGPQLG